jgi:hypothetical protein
MVNAADSELAINKSVSGVSYADLADYFAQL